MISSYTAVVGSRQLPPCAAEAVKVLVAGILQNPGAGIVSGGAMGADHFAIRALLELGECPRGLIVTPWRGFEGFPSSIRKDIQRFAAQGGQIEWGLVPTLTNRAQVIAGLFGRNSRLIRRAGAVAAIPHGTCNGTAYTIRRAQEHGIPVTIYSWDETAKKLKPERIPERAMQISLFQHSPA